jgi:hypothetical protein
MVIRKNRILKICKVKIRRVAHEREKNAHSRHHCGAGLVCTMTRKILEWLEQYCCVVSTLRGSGFFSRHGV